MMNNFASDGIPKTPIKVSGKRAATSEVKNTEKNHLASENSSLSTIARKPRSPGLLAPGSNTLSSSDVKKVTSSGTSPKVTSSGSPKVGMTTSNSAATIKASNSPVRAHRRKGSGSGKIPNIITPSMMMSIGSIDDSDRLDRSNRSYSSASYRSRSHRGPKVSVKPLSNPGSASASVATAMTNDRNSKVPGKRFSSSTNNSTNGDPATYTYTSTKNMRSEPTKISVPSSSTASKLSPHLFENVKVPKMKEDISRCNLFCAFYCEFDNIVGPKVSFQAPRYFMDRDIAMTTEEIEYLLSKSFKSSSSGENTENKGNVSESTTGGEEQSHAVAEDKQHETEQKAATPKAYNTQPISKPTVPQNSQSIFDSTCEYIITGNELTGKLMSLSTHNLHIIAKPTIIMNSKYERNSLLFSVGFVVRRKSDPSPFYPLLSRLASTLRSMEIESGFLSSPTKKTRIQHFLNVIVSSLNSPSSKCHLLLDDANFLHLQYFPPPRNHAPPVSDYEVPVLLRPEYMLQIVDWDLTINWIVPHVDGVKHAKLIAESSKVDEEMVLSCLRVLRHHKVLACIDMFRYSNIYESTLKAQKLVAGETDDLLREAYRFVSKHSMASGSHSVGSNIASSLKSSKSLRVGNTASTGVGSGGKVTLLAPISGPSSYPPVNSAFLHPESIGRKEAAVSTSFTSGTGAYDAIPSPTPSSNSRSSKSSTNIGAGILSSQVYAPPLSVTPMTPGSTSYRVQHLPGVYKRERERMMSALAILYASCERGITLREVWMNKVKDDKSETENTSTAGASNGKNMNSGKQAKKKKSKMMKHRSLSNGSASSMTDSISNIDWMEVFNHFDHRRFVTFGIIHGLISRVHEYPFVCSTEIRDEDDNDTHNDNENHRANTSADNGSTEVEPMPMPPTALKPERHSSFGNGSIRSGAQATSPKHFQTRAPIAQQMPFIRLDSISPAGSVVIHPESMDNTHNFVSGAGATTIGSTPKSSHAIHMLSNKIANSMDGTRCDDELSCMYQKSIKELKDLVRKYSKLEVVSIYSASK